MPSIQEIFIRIQASKKEQKELKAMYSDALKSNQEYQNVKDEIGTLKDKKKTIETALQSNFSSEFSRLDYLKLDIESDRTLMTDSAISQLMEGKTVEVTDEYDNKYEPIFGVRFKKV